MGNIKFRLICYSYYRDSLQHDALKLIGSKKKASLALEGVFAEDILSDMGDIGDSGASALYKSLVGKIKLKEDDLDFFSEEEEYIIEDGKLKEGEEIIRNTMIENIVETPQLSFFTISEEDVERKSKLKRKISVGQITLFEM